MEQGKIFKFHNDLDTDQIIASQYLLLPNLEEMKSHAFESLDPDFAQKVKPGDILGAIAGESGISGRLVGSIDMYDKYTFVEVPQDCAEEVLECMKNARIKGKSIHMEPANGR